MSLTMQYQAGTNCNSILYNNNIKYGVLFLFLVCGSDQDLKLYIYPKLKLYD